MHDIAEHEMTKPPGPPGRSDSAAEQRESIFHELHADGRNALCGVCESQYWPYRQVRFALPAARRARLLFQTDRGPCPWPGQPVNWAYAYSQPRQR